MRIISLKNHLEAREHAKTNERSTYSNNILEPYQIWSREKKLSSFLLYYIAPKLIKWIIKSKSTCILWQIEYMQPITNVHMRILREHKGWRRHWFGFVQTGLPKTPCHFCNIESIHTQNYTKTWYSNFIDQYIVIIDNRKKILMIMAWKDYTKIGQ